jgi:hypothetical protein
MGHAFWKQPTPGVAHSAAHPAAPCQAHPASRHAAHDADGEHAGMLQSG